VYVVKKKRDYSKYEEYNIIKQLRVLNAAYRYARASPLHKHVHTNTHTPQSYLSFALTTLTHCQYMVL